MSTIVTVQAPCPAGLSSSLTSSSISRGHHRHCSSGSEKITESYDSFLAQLSSAGHVHFLMDGQKKRSGQWRRERVVCTRSTSAVISNLCDIGLLGQLFDLTNTSNNSTTKIQWSCDSSLSLSLPGSVFRLQLTSVQPHRSSFSLPVCTHTHWCYTIQLKKQTSQRLTTRTSSRLL